MTKLEQKLIELGYKRTGYFNFIKQVSENSLLIKLDVDRKKILETYVDYYAIGVSYQWQIDNLQQAFNQLQKDLEALKGCEQWHQMILN